MPKYSQVFLKDVRMCERIASVLEPVNFVSAVEIGPGRGALTEFLCTLWGDKLSVVEIDPLMTNRIKEKFPGLRVNNSDFLALNLEASFPAGPVAFIGNLPYECSTAILMKVLAFSRFGAAVFMFQREVARKITAETGDSDYGYLSVAVQAQSEAELVADVPAGSFSPVPEVDSSVLVFSPRQTFPDAEKRGRFLGFVKNAFSHRRKTLLNSLSMGLNIDKAEVEPLIKAAGFDPRLRPQNLSVKDYLKLSIVFSGGK
ncbi:MAG: ribosomal RNA small subunit methyltransferase A [Elusimicrobia bacterium RIFOXYA12_FULL_51_18]|nr:MAG: ribosomal RNA small subunit methyltransferase A [Elusimicrobia bacterium RIFOXYA12_FULL_51_18]OGS31272.1 MAG: ribosomal RNA small subunit methyltransferase A [Elusimicrobia bacterium RIFOXYA2_FULL_53_38]